MTIATTISELAAEPRLAVAMARIDEQLLKTDIARAIKNLNAVNSETAAMLATHFATRMLAVNEIFGTVPRQNELKRIAMSLSLINIGDL